MALIIISSSKYTLRCWKNLLEKLVGFGQSKAKSGEYK
jgi:hypothetical protein